MTLPAPGPKLTVLALAVLLGGVACTAETDMPAVPDPAPTTPPPTEASVDLAQLRKARAERNRALNATAQRSGPSTASQAQRDYYRRLEARLLAQGRLRSDRVPQDAAIDAETLARNFIQIALRSEYDLGNGTRMVPTQQAAPLRRWRDPVRIQLHFGPWADAATQTRLRTDVADYAARLARATGHEVTLTGENGNFLVLFLNEDERRDIQPRLLRLVPDMPAEDVVALRDLDPGNLCTVFAYSRGGSDVYAQAVALIRAELPPLLRLSCIHEELAQGLGLANDSPAARPSIFNDDEEFALLTRHDELLLRILYDPRLRPGMTEAEAAPIVYQIARELLPSNS